MLSNSSSMSQILTQSAGGSCNDLSFLSTKGNYIGLGNHKRTFEGTHRNSSSLLLHDDGPREISHSQSDFHGSLSQTRFHRGFQRRGESNISNILKDQEIDYRKSAEIRKEEMRHSRSQTLIKVASSTKYDIVNGKLPPSQSVPPEKPVGIKMCGDGLGDEAPKRGSAILRESVGRYFAPYPTGKNAEYRQEVLLKSGISKQKTSSIIQLGRSDLSSYGVDDQFAKSGYTRHKEITGLHEMTRPGAYSPLKQPRNPSGNSQLVKTWGKGVSLKMP